MLCVGVGGFGAELAPAPDLAGWGAGRDRLAWAALFTDARLDPARVQLRVELGRGVAAIGPQLGWGQAAIQQLIDERQQMGALVLVAWADPDRKRGAPGINDYMETASWAAAEGARDLAAPFFASASEASTITRDESVKPSRSSSSCMRSNSRSQTPAACHS
jgi:hypothetical protein